MTERRVVPDDHLATIEHFLGVLAREGHALHTVVHVGAHAGEEVAAYRRHGAQRILLVEANPESCAGLARRFAGEDDIEVVHAAATDHEGTARLRLHTNARGGTESASLLRMSELGRIVPTLQTAGEVEVPAITIDGLLLRCGIAPNAIGLLTIDVQGAELHVLRGARQALTGVRAVLTEVALVDLYDGAAQEEDVERLLADAGFESLDALYYELYEADRRFAAWGDRLFVRPTG